MAEKVIQGKNEIMKSVHVSAKIQKSTTYAKKVIFGILIYVLVKILRM